MTRPPALILTAGLGTRLRPLTYVRAKAAVPVNGQPLARRVARWLASAGFEQLVFNLHHHPATITAAIGDGMDLGVAVRYSWENPVLGSAGGPRHALPLLTDGGHRSFLIVNGDTLTNVDLGAVLASHETSGAAVTMALIPNPSPEKYGGVTVTSEGYVAGFTHPRAGVDSYHFIGVQVADATAFADLADNVRYESVMMLYPEMIRSDPRSIGAYISSARFRDIGTPADYLNTSLQLVDEEGDHLIAQSARVHPDAVLERTAVWDDVDIGAGARLVDSIVADGVRIPEGASFARCAIVPAAGRSPARGERIDGGLLICDIDSSRHE